MVLKVGETGNEAKKKIECGIRDREKEVYEDEMYGVKRDDGSCTR